MGTRSLGPKEIDELFMPPGKANTCTLRTGHLITAAVNPGKVVQAEPSHMSLNGLVGWLYLKHCLVVMTVLFWVQVL